MALKIKKSISIVFLSFLLIIFSNPAAGEKRTLTRYEDFLVIVGEDVPSLIGAETGDLRLYSCERGSCRPVPVQVDKLDFRDRYVFPTEEYADRDGTTLDVNDEISFMASDSGSRRPRGFKPPASVRGVEIELVDPLDNGRAWAYLFDEPDGGVPRLDDYVSYRDENNYTSIESPQYVIGYENEMIYYNQMRALTPGGELGPDILDRQRVGMVAQLAGKQNLPLNAPESIVRVKDLAAIDGTIRVIIDQVVVLHIVNLNFRWGMEYFVAYYRCGQNNSVFFSFPTAANKLVKTINFYWSLDFTDHIIGATYLDPFHLDPYIIRAQTLDSLPGDDFHYWYGVYGNNGALVQALDLAPETAEYFVCNARWHQDPDARDRKGEHPGRLEIGFVCSEKENIPEHQEYHWFNYILFPAEPTAEGVKELTKIFEHPLEVKIEALP